jgi:hypothetical protein
MDNNAEHKILASQYSSQKPQYSVGGVVEVRREKKNCFILSNMPVSTSHDQTNQCAVYFVPFQHIHTHTHTHTHTHIHLKKKANLFTHGCMMCVCVCVCVMWSHKKEQTSFALCDQFPCDKYAPQIFWLSCCTHRLHYRKGLMSRTCIPSEMASKNTRNSNIQQRDRNSPFYAAETYVFYASIC